MPRHRKCAATASAHAEPPTAASLPARRCRKTAPVALAVGKRNKASVLQTALLAHGAEPAMILVILALMGTTGTVRLRRSRPDTMGDGTLAPAVRAVFAKYRPRFDGCLDDDAPPAAGLRLRYWEPSCQTKAFEALCGFKPCEMHELFAAFIASCLTNDSGYSDAKADTALAVALAREIGAAAPDAWQTRS